MTVQDANLFQEEVVRKFYDLKWFNRNGCSDDILQKIFIQIDIVKAIFLEKPFYQDEELLLCVKFNSEQCLKALSGIKNIFHNLVKLDRTKLASFLMTKLPVELLKEKDEDGRNILHILIEYISIYNMRCFAFISDMIKIVGTHCPEQVMIKYFLLNR